MFQLHLRSVFPLTYVVGISVMHAHQSHANLVLVVWSIQGVLFFFLSSSPWPWSLISPLPHAFRYLLYFHTNTMFAKFPLYNVRRAESATLTQHLLSSFPSSFSFCASLLNHILLFICTLARTDSHTHIYTCCFAGVYVGLCCKSINLQLSSIICISVVCLSVLIGAGSTLKWVCAGL